jgi:hypothetical protein
MTWVVAGGAAVSAAGTGLGILGGQSAARKKNRILGEGSREQTRAGGEAAGTLAGFIEQLRSSTPTPGAERGAFTGAMAGPAVSGPMTASRQFQGDARGATTATRAYGTKMADWLARMRAPGLQRQRENELLVNAGNAIRPITSRAQDEDFMTQYRAGNVKENPLYGLAGQGLQGVGNYLIGG